MDNHPIPQDVTGFKFKLIGSITVKQFGYLLAFSILAYIFFILPGPFLLRLPFVLLFAATGVGLAFVPIDGRPMDKMLWYLLKAIPSDNEYVYRKTGMNLALARILKTPIYQRKKADEQKKGIREKNGDRIRHVPPSMPKGSMPPLELESSEASFIDTIKNIFDTMAPIPQVQTSQNTGQIASKWGNFTSTGSLPPLPKNIAIGQTAKEKAKAQAQIPTPSPKKETKKDFFDEKKPAQPHTPESPLATQEGIATHDDMLQGKFLELAKQQSTSSPQQPAAQNMTQRVTSLSEDLSVKAGFPLLPDVPNIILGIVKDPRGKILPNILVEIFDKNNIPVRAFKTTPLGQFASATALPNGEYTIKLEDPMKRNEFDTIRIILDGKIFNPIQIISTDDREKLRKELFENN